jgi:DNA polymerase/3'-5' exonuclease PolX
MDNRIIAECLRCHAQELDAEGGNLYRVRAYRHAAEIVVELAEPVSRIFERGGRRGLQALPHAEREEYTRITDIVAFMAFLRLL